MRCLSRLALVGGLALAFLPMSMLRLVDGDEGTYLLVMRQVLEGVWPFHDVFYPQMFLLPYLYAAWMAVAGTSWFAGRLLSALLTVALGVLLHALVRRLTGRPALAWVATAAFMMNSLALGWFPLVKTYPAATLLLMGACALLMRAGPAARPLVAGVLLGLAIDIRLYLACLVPVFALHAALDAPARWRRVVRLAAGLALGLLPNLVFIAPDPGRWLFNVAGVHGVRSEWGYVGAFEQKLSVVKTLLGFGFEPGLALQYSILLLLNAGLALVLLKTRQRPPLSLTLVPVLLVVSLVPTPTFTQYHVMAVPLLVLNAALFLARVPGLLPAARLPVAAAAARVALVIAGAGYAAVVPFEVHRFVVTGEGTPDMGLPPINATIPMIRAVGQVVDDEVGAAGPRPVVSWWPGYFVETRARILPRMENHFTVEFAPRLTAAEVERYRFMTPAALEAAIRERRVDVVVLGNWIVDPSRSRMRRLLENSHYVRVRRVGDADIYRWTGRSGDPVVGRPELEHQ
jgi:hypothetical protein